MHDEIDPLTSYTQMVPRQHHNSCVHLDIVVDFFLSGGEEDSSTDNLMQQYEQCLTDTQADPYSTWGKIM